MPDNSPPLALVAHITVSGASAAVDFYKTAFGFTEVSRVPTPDGKLLHCSLRLGNSQLFVADEFPRMGPGACRAPLSLGGTTVTLHIDCPDVDAAVGRAVDAGARITMPITDMFWGARYGKVEDPYGHQWSLATQKEVVSPEELKQRAAKLFANWAP